MLSKEKLRKKFLLIRKNRYFEIDKNFFNPFIRVINPKLKKKKLFYHPIFLHHMKSMF